MQIYTNQYLDHSIIHKFFNIRIPINTLLTL